MDAERFEMAEQFVALAFPHLAKRAVPVSYNWLGHIFTLDLARREGDEPLMLMFEPESEEVLDIPCGLAAFHDEELLNYPDEALREGLYANWLKAGGKAPALDECVGYNVPFFLNGSDEMNNLGLTDIHVYWYLTAQLIDRVRDLPLGTRIGKITIEDP